jgi:hypothetical protein
MNYNYKKYYKNKNETMKFEYWKQKYGDENPKKELLETIMEEVGATIIKHHKKIALQCVSGKCLTYECEYTYEKQLRTLLKSGPFCNFCSHYSVDGRKLIKDYRPDIYNSIVRCDIDKDLLIAGSSVIATYQCGHNCSRCETPHEWSSSIRKRIVPSKFDNCPFCSGNRSCECIKENEFRCYICKKIKDDKERHGDTTRCKLCARQMNDEDKKKMIHYIWQRTNSIMKRDKHKCGDLTEKFLLEKYETQGGLCFISGIPMALGTFHDWQISVERAREDGPYSNDNVVLICREFQHGCRQYSKDVWDEMCALVIGVEENQDENEKIDKMIREEIETPDYKLQLPPKPDHSTTREDGKRYCKYCEKWKTQEEMAYKKASKCKVCRKIERDKQKSTFHGRMHYLFRTAFENHTRRKIEFDIIERDIEDIYLKQRGRCHYSGIPLGFSGQYQMSLERVNPKKGYTPENIALIVLGLNVADYTRVKHEDDKRDGSSGWNRQKLLEAIQQNPRSITPKSSSVLEVLEKLRMEKKLFDLRK